MKNKSIAFVVFGEENSARNALTEDNYKPLADSLIENGFNVESVLFHDTRIKHLEKKLPEFDAVMVWVDAIVQGVDRRPLDTLLIEAAKKGVFVSTHPDIIQKIGTKQVLFSTKDMDWGGDIELYSTYQDFESRFFSSLDGCSSNIRVLKKYRGSNGNGVYKVYLVDNDVCLIPAPSPEDKRVFSKKDFLEEFRGYFEDSGILINQPWANGIINGMVRAYMTENKVTGFGYQESIALCQYTNDLNSQVRPVSRRFYFSEHCGLFQDLRSILESKWIPQLLEIHSISSDANSQRQFPALPLLWDIDLFINDVNNQSTEKKYTLCEINVSGVSPFPPSCINYVVEKLKKRLL